METILPKKPLKSRSKSLIFGKQKGFDVIIPDEQADIKY